jgi:uncharacterized membrane protein (DUF2068 family)
MQRPTGITILAVLAAIGGVFGVLAGLALLGIGAVAATAGLGGLAAFLGLVALVYGVLSLVLAYGFWTLKPWAWTLGVGLEIAGILINVLQYVNNTNRGLFSTIVGIAINAAILWYLYQPNVKSAFGRA